ncbi:hypothetical protein AB1286_02645 [Trinickia sp. NRRL B-1857]|uniref:hypothetical protein n=1 Tax=Trinickia sp. NRRL B-1857 TaxID=3162879 RepID=UPI003D2C4F04
MKHLMRFVMALMLTGPVFLGLSRIDPLARWVGSEAAWSTLSPLFRLFDAVGIEGEETILLCVLLVLSFVVSTAIIWSVAAVLARLRTNSTITH